MKASVHPDPRAVRQLVQVEPIPLRRAEQPAGLRIAGVEDLEAAVERPSVDPVAAGPAADAVAGLQHGDGASGSLQVAGRAETGKAGTDHHDLRLRHLAEASAGGAYRRRIRRLSTGRMQPARCRSNLPPMQQTVPMVEGLRLVERTGDAGRGEVWRARRTGGLAGVSGERLPGELAGVGECTVRLLRLPVDEAMRARALALAHDLMELDDAGIVRVLSAKACFDGLALILDAPAPPVTGLHELARVRQLAAGEVVTIGVAASWALAAAHQSGLTHGQLRDADVLLPAGGRPMLAGVGVMGVLGAPGGPDDDVRALARLLSSVLDHESGGAQRILAALEPAWGAEPDTPQELSARLAEATPALPVAAIGGSTGEPLSESPAHRRPARLRRRHLVPVFRARRAPGGRSRRLDEHAWTGREARRHSADAGTHTCTIHVTGAGVTGTGGFAAELGRCAQRAGGAVARPRSRHRTRES